MSHALTSQIPHVTATAQAADAPPADDHLPPDDAAPADRPGTTRELAEWIAERLTTLDLTRGQFMQAVSTVAGHDTVVLDLAMLTGDEATARVVLTLSLPPRSTPEQGDVEPRDEGEVPAT